MKRQVPQTALLGVLAAFSVASPAGAAVTLFADTFDRPDNTDLNAATTGKSGTLGALDWVEVVNAGSPQIVSNNLRLGETGGGGGGWSIAYLNHNFTDALITSGGEFTVSIDLGAVASAGGTRFTGFAVGHSLAEVNGWSANNPTSFVSDFFFGYDPTGTTEVKVFINGGTQDYQRTVNLSSGAALLVRFSGISGFNAGSAVNYEAFIDGGSVNAGSFTWSGTDENYLALYSNYTLDRGTVDRFEVSAVSEPSLVALLALGSLVLLRRRQ